MLEAVVAGVAEGPTYLPAAAPVEAVEALAPAPVLAPAQTPKEKIKLKSTQFLVSKLFYL